MLLKWETGETATMNILVVHSMIVLLTYGRPAGNHLQPGNMTHLLLMSYFGEKHTYHPSIDNVA